MQSILFLTLVCSYFPVKYTLANGQINTFILLFVVFFVNWFVKKRDTLAGVILAITVTLKLFPLFILPYLIFIKRFSIIKSFFISLLIISFFALMLIPFPVIFAYFNSILPLLFHEGGGTYYFDQSLSAFLARSINSYIAAQITKPLSLLILFITYVILWKHRHNNKIELLSIGILLILNIILGNFAWQHHFIWLIVPYIITFIYLRDSQLSKKFYIILSISYLLTAANIPNPRLVPPILQSHVFYGAVILYCLLMYFILKQPKLAYLQKNKSKMKDKLIPKSKTK